MTLGPHANFIIAAYAVAAAVVAALAIWIVADHHEQLRTLKDLEAKGMKRRSGTSEREAS